MEVIIVNSSIKTKTCEEDFINYLKSNLPDERFTAEKEGGLMDIIYDQACGQLVSEAKPTDIKACVLCGKELPAKHFIKNVKVGKKNVDKFTTACHLCHKKGVDWARNQICKSLLRPIFAIAKTTKNNKPIEAGMDDIIQEGMYDIVCGLNEFGDIRFNSRNSGEVGGFLSFILQRARNRMIKFSDRKMSVVSIPAYLIDVWRKCYKFLKYVEDLEGDERTEAIHQLMVENDSIGIVPPLVQIKEAFSVYMVRGNPDYPIEIVSTIDTDNDDVTSLFVEDLEKVLYNILTPLERNILKGLLGLNCIKMTSDELAVDMGLSLAEVLSLRTKAIKKLKVNRNETK